MSPVLAPITNASGCPASLAEVKSHLGERPEPEGFRMK